MTVQLTGGSSKPKRPAKASSVPVRRLPGAKAANVQYGPGPVKVWAQPTAAKVTKQSVRANNRQIGQKVFSYTPKKSKADVVVKVSKKLPNATAQATGKPGNWSVGANRGQVKIAGFLAKPPAKIPKSTGISKKGQKQLSHSNRVVVQHELLHTVGLNHENINAAIRGKTMKQRRKQASEYGIMALGNKVNKPEAKAVKNLRSLANRKAAQRANEQRIRAMSKSRRAR